MGHSLSILLKTSFFLIQLVTFMDFMTDLGSIFKQFNDLQHLFAWLYAYKIYKVPSNRKPKMIRDRCSKSYQISLLNPSFTFSTYMSSINYIETPMTDVANSAYKIFGHRYFVHLNVPNWDSCIFYSQRVIFLQRKYALPKP